jgi:hypothetical protein
VKIKKKNQNIHNLLKDQRNRGRNLYLNFNKDTKEIVKAERWMIVWLKMTKIEKKQNEKLFPQNKEKEMTQKGEK